MGLTVYLKANERIIIGPVVLRNAGRATRISIEGDNLPILREKDILNEVDANTPCKRLYYLLQAIYIETNKTRLFDQFLLDAREIASAAPSLKLAIAKIFAYATASDYYKALKECRILIEMEHELLSIFEPVPKPEVDASQYH